MNNNNHKAKHPIMRHVYHLFFMFIGTVIAAGALEIFLIPNGLLDGGVTGIAIMVSHLAGLPLGILTFVLNIPFLIVAYRRIGKQFLVYALLAIVSFSVCLSVIREVVEFDPMSFEPTHDVMLAVLFGGVILGAGVGLVIRFGGSLDGTEMVAIIVSRVTPISVGQIVLLFNVVIFGVAATIFGFDKAMYSLVTYFIASKVIDIVVEGFDESKSVMIVSGKYDEIATALSEQLNVRSTFLDASGSYSNEQTKVVYVILTRFELSKLKDLVMDIDDKAFMAISNVADVHGGEYAKKSGH